MTVGYIPPRNFNKIAQFVQHSLMNYEQYLKKIGENITKIRKKKGLTGIELSLRCEMDKSDLIHIEKGRTNITIKTLTKIANELGIELKEFLN